MASISFHGSPVTTVGELPATPGEGDGGEGPRETGGTGGIRHQGLEQRPPAPDRERRQHQSMITGGRRLVAAPCEPRDPEQPGHVVISGASS